MELTKKEKTIKYGVYCLLIALGALLQNVGGLWFEIGSARCFFLIPIAIIIGIDEDEKISAFLGLLAGMLWDSVSGQQMCFNAIFLMIVCFFISALVTYLLRSTYWVGVIGSVICSFIYVVLYWLLFVITKGGDGAVQTFGYFYIPCFIYTALMSLVLGLVLMPIKRRVDKNIE
jgi:rod shape-determining protein MreD